MDLEAAQQQLQAFDQTHLLSFWEGLSKADQSALLSDIEQVDWQRLTILLTTERAAPAEALDPIDLAAPRAISAEGGEHQELLSAARAAGESRLAAGEVAALTVAGGQGTRLGFDGPKGMFEITPLRNKPLFEVFAEGILAARRRYGAAVRWYIMTSRENDQPTRAFFAERSHFGLPPEDVIFFTQGTMPAVDADGKVLLANRHRLALTPDGHGGTLRALHDSGALARMAEQGTRSVSYFQVDNPLVQVLDPTFLGLLDAGESEAVSKAVRKAYDAEKVGVFIDVRGRLQVVEYSHMPAAVAEHRSSDGRLTFDLANIAVHAFTLDLIRRLTSGDTAEALPYHRATKPVAAIDPHSGAVCDPPPTASKYEQFIFDCLPRARNPLVYEIPRSEEFSPVKNAEGVDSPETARAAVMARARSWLRAAGVAVPDDRAVEISPLFATSAEALRQRLAEHDPLDTTRDICLD